MTVVVSVVCSDGVVIGADTQITDSDRGMSYPGQSCRRWVGTPPGEAAGRAPS